MDALTLARAGADVVIADLLVESELSEETDAYGPLATVARTQGLVGTESAAEEIRAMGRRAFAVKCDVTDRDQVAAAVARAVDELGSVDILVNNAGTLDHVGQFHDQQPELWERDLRVNLTGAFNCAQAVWPHMKERQWGRIVNMASVAGTLGGFGQASYSTTKAGLLGLTKTLAMEGGRHGITRTRSCRGSSAPRRSTWRTPAMNERIANRTVFKRPGEPQDIANAIAFLCSDLAAYVTGHRAQRLRRRRALRVLVRCSPATLSAWPPRPRPFAAALCAVPGRGPGSASPRSWRSRSSSCCRSSSRARQDRLAEGTRIGGIDVGGLSAAEAQALLAGAGRPPRHRPGHVHRRRQALPADRAASSASQSTGAPPSTARSARAAASASSAATAASSLELFPQDVAPPTQRLRRRRSTTSCS